MIHRNVHGFGKLLFIGVIPASIAACASAAFASPEQENGNPVAATSAAASGPSQGVRKMSPYRPVSVPNSAMSYFHSIWGVDKFLVRATASENLIRFSYRVTDPARAKALGDKRATPYMYGQRSNAVLQIPVMDKIGELRQTGIQEARRNYWMTFSNKGGFVKVGDRVNVTIGSFHADGLIVE